MRISNIQTLHADGGYRTCSYVKVSTDEGLVGWSEYYDAFSGTSLSPLIAAYGQMAKGMDPTAYGTVSEHLLATTRPAKGGVNHQAVAAIENACLDIAAKAAGLPVARLLGGPFRSSMRLYWTHCGSFRARHAEAFESWGYQPVRRMEDLEAMGREVVARGFTAAKTNPLAFGEKPTMANPGFRIAPGFLDRSITSRQLSVLREQLLTLKSGLGPEVDLMLDVNFSQRTEGGMRIARALEDLGLYWLEIDIHDPEALACVRRSSRMPIASLESLHGIDEYRPYITGRTVDTVIVDVMWNGVYQSVKVANLADAFETHVAPHNPVGDLGSLMSLHFCAAVPNARIMEYRPDEAPWTKQFLTHPLDVKNGCVTLPDRPGWGADINEDALASHPVRRT